MAMSIGADLMEVYLYTSLWTKTECVRDAWSTFQTVSLQGGSADDFGLEAWNVTQFEARSALCPY